MGRERRDLVKLLGPYYGYSERKKREAVKVEPTVKRELTDRLKRFSSIPD